MKKIPTNPIMRRVLKGSVPPKVDQATVIRLETERLLLWLASWAGWMSNDRGAVESLAGGSSTTIEGREAATNYMTAEDDSVLVNDLRAQHTMRELADAIDSLMHGKMWAWWTIYRMHGLRRKEAGLWSFAALEADLAGAYARAVDELRQVVNRRGLAL